MGLDALNYVGLAETRQLALQNKHLVIKGKDPIEERKNAQMKMQLEKSRNLTFKEIGKTCIASKSHEWKNAKHLQQWSISLEAYAFPILGKR